ncbi:MAG: hypothetical protein LBJ64_10500 [Deltaproteobacteria bacterium]|jgi:hypothetical protein|nr:hypothetical protein [Deltaproteobacteria bacterium]
MSLSFIKARSFKIVGQALLLALLASLPFLSGCAVAPQANNEVIQPLPEDWQAKVLTALVGQAEHDGLKYEADGATFEGLPQPCMFTPDGGLQRDETVRAHCGALLVRPAGRTKLPPSNYIYLIKEDGQVDFIKQD